MSIRPSALVAALLGGVVALSGCSAVSGSGPRAVRQLHLVASFYPLQWVAQQVAGSRATVGSLTKPGAEPHDLELSPRDVVKVAAADLIVYVKGFQAAVDSVVSKEAGGRGFDVSPAADLNLRYDPVEGGRRQGKGATDPHFWLDPIRLRAVAAALAVRLAKLDPGNAATYRVNADTLRAKLTALDGDFRAGLADCANKDLVTSHNAFGYLGQRYGLVQVGITGLTPEAEPNPADLAMVAEFVRTNHVRTIYYETLVSPAVARAVAAETGASTAVLDPIEGLTRESRGSNYLEVMRSNLASIKKGQPCP
ncbi:MAG: metal ABC transporter substrate-binding protein [Pseudonocardiales bacterium]